MSDREDDEQDNTFDPDADDIDYDDDTELEEDEEDDNKGTTINNDSDNEELCDFEELADIYTDETEEIDTTETSNVEMIHTSPYLSKYERAKVLAVRVAQLEKNAPSTVTAEDFTNGRMPENPQAIAMRELELRRLPLMIRRPFPNGESKTIAVSKLLIS